MKSKIWIFLFIATSAFGQNTIGLPDVINYNKYAYNGGLQNWDIKDDNNGLIYIANNEGLLSFDGTYWKIYALPNKTIVRSVEITEDNKIFVGGQDELGYFSPDSQGRLKYKSLVQYIPKKDRSFGDVWDIVLFNKEIFFRTTSKIFKFNDTAASTFQAPSEWGYLAVSNNSLYAQDFSSGILAYQNNIWKPLINSIIPENDPVTGILSLTDNTSIVTTLKNGLYTISGNRLLPIPSTNQSLFQNSRIYTSTVVNDQWIALGTSNNGVLIVDHKGNIIQTFAETEGLQNNNILSILLDKQGNLWLGQDNGIDCIAYNSAVKHINPKLQNSSGYSAIIGDKTLYMGTSNGLYNVSLQAFDDYSFSKGNFDLVENTRGQVWTLADINDQILLGHHDGAFSVKNNVAYKISNIPGIWNFTPTSFTFPIPTLIAGHYKGLQFFNYFNGTFSAGEKVDGFDESSRFVTLDKDDNIWVSHPYHGIFKLSKNAKGTFTQTLYSTNKGLPTLLNNHIFKIKNQLLAATEKGVYQYNQAKDAFELSGFYKSLLGTQSIRYLKEDVSGNIWFIHEKELGVIDCSGKTPVIIKLPELNRKMLSGFEFIYPLNPKNIFIGAEKGFFLINYEKYIKTIPELKIQISSVKIIDKSDSILFGGYSEFSNNTGNKKSNIPSIAQGWKAIRFEFSSPFYAYQSNLEYSYRLSGFDDTWSEWTKRTEKEYTNLPGGNYLFEVKVRNNLGKESTVASYGIYVLPPWYLSIWAYIIYTLLASALIVGIVRWQRKKFSRQQEAYENEQKKLKYIFELERNRTESELVSLRNQKLEAEINLKNAEMASSAMHLAKKGELLKRIKVEFTQVMKRVDNEEAITELKKIIRKLSDDDKIDTEWDTFAIHFDKTHSDFVIKIKAKHPDLTANEIKLCIYLRMNLSTKEIAQFLNISVRGVEISRYRLRKKLALATEISLFDYLISVNNN